MSYVETAYSPVSFAQFPSMTQFYFYPAVILENYVPSLCFLLGLSARWENIKLYIPQHQVGNTQ